MSKNLYLNGLKGLNCFQGGGFAMDFKVCIRSTVFM